MFVGNNVHTDAQIFTVRHKIPQITVVYRRQRNDNFVDRVLLGNLVNTRSFPRIIGRTLLVIPLLSRNPITLYPLSRFTRNRS